jgi:hypothetical protein
VSLDTHEEMTLKDYDCELLLRYSLSYKHHLLYAYITEIPLPRSLFHS